jgi:ABC-type sugar transport system permease subunit
MQVSFERRRAAVGVAFVAPAIAVLLAVLGYPIARTALLAFQIVETAGGNLVQTWVGLENFERLFTDETFHTAVLNTAVFCMANVVLVVGGGLMTAVLLNQPQGRSGLFRILLIIPWAIAPVANAILWKWILNSNYGALNAVLKGLGIIDNYQIWLGSPRSALFFLLLVDVWKSLPFITLLLLAGLQRIPAVLYRAAFMDGAGPWNSFLHITLPSMKGAIAIGIILQTIWSLRVFDTVYVLTRGGPADATVLLNFLAYRVTFNFLDIGYGAAIANLIFFLSSALAVVYIALMRPRKGSVGR